MKQFFIVIILLCFLSCKKEANSSVSFNNSEKFSNSSIINSTISAAASVTTLNVKDQGAKGDGVADDTKAIRNALIYAKAHGIANVYFPDGTYIIGETGDGGGIIKLVNGVGMTGNGPATCHIKLTTGRSNPNPLFYQDYVNDPSIGDLVIQGIDFNGMLGSQSFDASYQYGHAFKFFNGKNIEIKNCKFQSFRGDGLVFGDVFENTLNVRIITNVSVHDCEFFSIYREGTLFCCVNGASFFNNNVHGDGYLVGGVDIERHSVNETVLNVSVYNNIFNFGDGYGPVERGGSKVRYRRAVTMGFFYSGYKNGVVDSLSGHHKVYNNKIYQGQIDCFGIVNVSISGNNIKNTYENITGVNYVTTPAINVSDVTATSGLINVSADNNIIDSNMGGYGISFKNYTKVTANVNTISNTRFDGVNIYNTSGYFYGNQISDVGTTAAPAAGVLINGNSSGLVVQNNTAINTLTGASRTVNYVVKIGSSNNGAVAPKLLDNKGKNMLAGIISQYYYQLNYILSSDNLAI
ncbi:glycosyl hydrolase family 28-related protein [Mucilaginibacter sp. FT3.2]|uniref:glycosyl hydrolase family 28-related protein n=1 Tax=Mucilaginibacter sp. FT3.2 TaxID=2723090 RepID=UPI00160BBD7B|nr:glycosyl hydrolase family 28-related protein [Mucilaginibacter sp. FT3.2]MBB6234183.1 hypothetical protein [Mucilaginibacter sp. FT3.2]